MIARLWVAQCDQQACPEKVVLEGDQHDGKWQLGEHITDLGWQASPAPKTPTYCPRHTTNREDQTDE